MNICHLPTQTRTEAHVETETEGRLGNASTLPPPRFCGVALKMWLASFITYFRMEIYKYVLSWVNNITAISS